MFNLKECVINLQLFMLMYSSIRLLHTFMKYKAAVNRLAYDLIYVTVDSKWLTWKQSLQQVSINVPNN